jgi:hypothetical protein
MLNTVPMDEALAGFEPDEQHAVTIAIDVRGNPPPYQIRTVTGLVDLIGLEAGGFLSYALDRADDVIQKMLDVMTPVLEATEDLADDDVDAAEKNLSDANEQFDSGQIDDYIRARDECRR